MRNAFCPKISIATTIDDGFFVGRRALPGNSYDGNTLAEALERVEILTDQRPELAVVERDYRGHGVETTLLFISGVKRALTPAPKKLLQRRSSMDSEIGHMITHGRLAKCPLKGRRGDAIYAVLWVRGHNLRKILNEIRQLLNLLLNLIARALPETVALKTVYRHPSQSPAV